MESFGTSVADSSVSPSDQFDFLPSILIWCCCQRLFSINYICINLYLRVFPGEPKLNTVSAKNGLKNKFKNGVLELAHCQLVDSEALPYMVYEELMALYILWLQWLKLSLVVKVFTS